MADYVVFVNGRRADASYLLQDGDEVLVFPNSLRGEAPMPPLRRFVKHLAKTYGMCPVTGTSARGRGDHVKWRHPDGWSIDVNPNHRDRKEVDKASIADLARKLKVPFGCVYETVMAPI